MRKTMERDTQQKLMVDVKGLAAMLSCGLSSARKIGEQAGARIQIGRRVLYSVEKVQEHIRLNTA